MNAETSKHRVRYFFEGNGEEQGPVSLEVLLGHVTRDTLVWRSGLEDWIPLAELPELKSLFGTTSSSGGDDRTREGKAKPAISTVPSGGPSAFSSGHHVEPVTPDEPATPQDRSDVNASGSGQTGHLPIKKGWGSRFPRVIWVAIISLIIVGGLVATDRDLSDRARGSVMDPSSPQSTQTHDVIDPPAGHPLRARLLDTVRPHIEDLLSTEVLFIVHHMRVLDRWAFFQGTPVDVDGYALPEHDLNMIFGDNWFLMDGVRTDAILEQIGQEWYLITFSVGSTDAWWISYCQDPQIRPVLLGCP